MEDHSISFAEALEIPKACNKPSRHLYRDIHSHVIALKVQTMARNMPGLLIWVFANIQIHCSDVFWQYYYNILCTFSTSYTIWITYTNNIQQLCLVYHGTQRASDTNVLYNYNYVHTPFKPPSVTAVFLTTFGKAQLVDSRVSASAVNSVLKGMSGIMNFNYRQCVWKHLIIHIRLLKNLLWYNTQSTKMVFFNVTCDASKI